MPESNCDWVKKLCGPRYSRRGRFAGLKNDPIGGGRNRSVQERVHFEVGPTGDCVSEEADRPSWARGPVEDWALIALAASCAGIVEIGCSPRLQGGVDSVLLLCERISWLPGFCRPG